LLNMSVSLSMLAKRVGGPELLGSPVAIDRTYPLLEGYPQVAREECPRKGRENRTRVTFATLQWIGR